MRKDILKGGRILACLGLRSVVTVDVASPSFNDMFSSNRHFFYKRTETTTVWLVSFLPPAFREPVLLGQDPPFYAQAG